MKLYVKDKDTGNKIYLRSIAPTRNKLSRKIGIKFYLRGNKYSIDDVFAETGVNSTTAGAIIGSLVGILGGPIGMIVSGSAGTVIGYIKDKDERTKMDVFNDSF